MICTFLLGVNPEARLSVAELAQILKEMQDWGRSHPGDFVPGASDDERMLFFFYSTADNEQQSLTYHQSEGHRSASRQLAPKEINRPLKTQPKCDRQYS